MNSYDYYCLEYLRRNTVISIKEKLKIEKMKNDLYDSYKELSRIEHTQLVVDYTKAYEYEYIVRYRKFLKKMFPIWKKYSDGLDIEEFTNKIICDNINEEKKLKLEVK